MSLRWKISLIIVVSVIIAVLSCGIVVRQSAARAEDDRMRSDAVSQLSDASSIYSDTGVLTLDSAIDDPSLPEEAREAALDGQSVTMRATLDGEDVMWAAGPITVGTHPAVISVRASAQESEELLASIDRAVLFGMIGSAVVIGGIGSFAAGRISRRLTLGAQTARKIAAGDTQVRISDVIESSDDEVTAFAQAVDTAVARLAERLDSEQRFTSDLAHEMRTPLTGLVNAANLLEEETRAAELVKERVSRLQELVEDLLEVSRLDAERSTPVMEPMRVEASVRSVLHTLQASGVSGDHIITTRFEDSGAVVVSDQRRFERIVANLVINGIKHGSDPVDVSTTERSLVVRDSGPGYPKDILANGPSRFVSSGGGGMGLGLVIAQGQARLLGMTITFTNDPVTGGARTEVTFPVPEAPATSAD